MKLLRLRTNLHPQTKDDVPLIVYTVGTEEQRAMSRLKGFSANQLFVTFAGSGSFRPLGEKKWDIVEPGSLLFIPADLPHEYVPQGDEPWQVGYVTYFERTPGVLREWGFGETPLQRKLGDTSRLFALLETMWRMLGDEYDCWQAAETLFAFLLALKKEASAEAPPFRAATPDPAQLRRSVVDNAVRFLHDHLQREVTMTELSARIGYSQKQLVRLFRARLGVTPMQYLLRIRLQTARTLLREHPHMTVRQTAAFIGMEPVYLTRLFRREFGVTPSSYAAGMAERDD
ncbi:MAG: helix-turn-helix transcriptional regulator [Paenibacillaceae bacterium]|nr:helix-turn-helix transcriptional regulator [Paenibacillaceae bacterium]